MGKVMVARSSAPPDPDPPSTLLTGLVAYWALSEASGTRADALGVHDATDHNGVATRSGKVTPLAASFVRADDPARYLTCAMHADFDFDGQQPFTVAAWFKLDSQEASMPFYSYIVGGCAGAGAGSGWNFFVSGNTVVLYLGAGDGTNTVCHAPGVVLGVWALGFGWYDPVAATNNGLVYGSAADAVADAKGPAANAAADLVFGCNAKTVGYRPWDGEIGPVMLWDRVLSAAERAELWAGGAGVAWPF